MLDHIHATFITLGDLEDASSDLQTVVSQAREALTTRDELHTVPKQLTSANESQLTQLETRSLVHDTAVDKFVRNLAFYRQGWETTRRCPRSHEGDQKQLARSDLQRSTALGFFSTHPRYNKAVLRYRSEAQPRFSLSL